MTIKAYFADYKAIIKLGLPILAAQLGTIAVSFADTLMVGRYSTEALASASFVNNVFYLAMFCCTGFTYGLLPLVGTLFAKDKRREIGRLLRNATALNVAFSILISLILTILYACIDRLGQPMELLPIIRPYFLLSMVTLIPVTIFSTFSQWSYGIKNTVLPMWITIFANIFNVIGNYLLIYGAYGFPEMGLTGAGISTLLARMGSAIAIILWFGCARGNREYVSSFFDTTGELFNRRTLTEIWRTSYPISMQLTLECGSFTVAAIMAGWLGTVPLAAYQIFVIVGTMGYTIYYAVGAAIAVVVSNAAGVEGSLAMRRAGWAGYHIMLCTMGVSLFAFIAFAPQLMRLFTDDTRVLEAALALIFPLSLYQLGDATQINFANALRGTSHVKPMLWIALVCYAIIGVPATYLCAFTAGLGLYGIVLSFSVSLFSAGALFLYFFLRATRPDGINSIKHRNVA